MLNNNIKKYLKLNIRKYTMFIALIAIWIIFAALTKGLFLTPLNLSNLLSQTVVVAIIAVGMTLILVTRNIDLSVGSVAAFTGALAAFLQVKFGWGTPEALSAALLGGLLIGLWHGYWIGYLAVPAFIVTLASMMIFRGGVLGLTQGETIAPLSDAFARIGEDFIPSNISILIGIIFIALYIMMELNGRKNKIKYGLHTPPLFRHLLWICGVSAVIAAFFGFMILNRGIPDSVMLLIALALAINFVAQRTVFGRRLFAIGGNPDAARLSGIDIKKNTLFLYAVFGVITAIAGIVLTARLDAATTSAGQGMELDVIAAAVIGGTSLMGGEGTVFGSLIGALIMASLDNGMSLMNTNITYQFIIKGMILLLAVWFDIATRRKR